MCLTINTSNIKKADQCLVTKCTRKWNVPNYTSMVCKKLCIFVAWETNASTMATLDVALDGN